MFLKGRWAAVLMIGVLVITSGCAIRRDDPPFRIALLAPFEGADRDIGYDALYAARLAFADAGTLTELTAIDDGGTAESAVDRAEALTGDPLTLLVIVLGHSATAPNTFDALADLPTLVVGEWSVIGDRASVFVLSSQELVTNPGDYRRDPIYRTSALAPTAEYAERITESDAFAPTPGLYSMLTYDAARIALNALHPTRSETQYALTGTDYTGLNGSIRFNATRYWLGAPVFTVHVTRLSR